MEDARQASTGKAHKHWGKEVPGRGFLEQVMSKS